MAQSRRPRKRRAGGTAGRRAAPVVPIVLAVAAGMVLGTVIFRGPDHAGLLHRVASGAYDASSAVIDAAISPRPFRICDDGRRITCVVDGDTFWLEGEKIRIADFDTPEVSEPQCASELQLGTRAIRRLVELLNQGPFELALASDGRDEDRYGRKLRIVLRDGRSIGDTLVAEGLAHPWRGRREPWC